MNQSRCCFNSKQGVDSFTWIDIALKDLKELMGWGFFWLRDISCYYGFMVMRRHMLWILDHMCFASLSHYISTFTRFLWSYWDHDSVIVLISHESETGHLLKPFLPKTWSSVILALLYSILFGIWEGHISEYVILLYVIYNNTGTSYSPSQYLKIPFNQFWWGMGWGKKKRNKNKTKFI